MDNVKLIMFKSTVSGIKYIYLVMQPLQASISRTFSCSQTESLPIKQSSSFPPPSVPGDHYFTVCLWIWRL